ncbi:monodechloroaminopyrrolnitrin synthase PrnB family protein [Streptomyces sp. NPDC006012]|uniref:monodechloroaminopyrrolnitrin synthase PrnB family protein n=1 Tax=Streptomyces sp. NPDC006012 TaxID=3364739 RepID=UPI00367DE4E7
MQGVDRDDRPGQVSNVFSSSRWNPDGPRRRTFTGQLPEKLLIQSVKQSLYSTMSPIDICAQLVESDPGSVDFARAATRLTNPLRSLEESVDVAVSGVSPQFFGIELRPYLESIRVAGAEYHGPAAAHVPVPLGGPPCVRARPVLRRAGGEQAGPCSRPDV